MATIKLSDFIMEQEVSRAECSDILMEQLQAEIDVNLALADAYAKQVLIEEYASEYTMEADESSTETAEKKDGKFKTFWKTIWSAIKGFFRQIGEKIGQFITWIKTKFGKAPSDKLREIAERASEEEAEEYLSKITKDFDVIVGKGGRLQPHLYDVENMKTLIETSDAWLDEAALAIEKVAVYAKNPGISGNNNAKMTKLRTWRNDLTKQGTDTGKDAKSSLKAMSEFLVWMDKTGTEKLKGLRDKIQKLNVPLDKAAEAIDGMSDESKKKYSELVSVCNDIRTAVSEKSIEILQSLADMHALHKAVQKATTDFDKAKTTVQADAKIRKFLAENPDASYAEISKATGLPLDQIKAYRERKNAETESDEK